MEILFFKKLNYNLKLKINFQNQSSREKNIF